MSDYRWDDGQGYSTPRRGFPDPELIGRLMEQDNFVNQLNREGFEEIVTVVREPHGGMGLHCHDFEAKALIIHGELRLLIDEIEHTYRVGDVFHLKAGLRHAESYGPEGVKYLVGRK